MEDTAIGIYEGLCSPTHAKLEHVLVHVASLDCKGRQNRNNNGRIEAWNSQVFSNSCKLEL